LPFEGIADNLIPSRTAHAGLFWCAPLLDVFRVSKFKLHLWTSRG